jgi:hypothetical protein
MFMPKSRELFFLLIFKVLGEEASMSLFMLLVGTRVGLLTRGF